MGIKSDWLVGAVCNALVFGCLFLKLYSYHHCYIIAKRTYYIVFYAPSIVE